MRNEAENEFAYRHDLVNAHSEGYKVGDESLILYISVEGIIVSVNGKGFNLVPDNRTYQKHIAPISKFKPQPDEILSASFRNIDDIKFTDHRVHISKWKYQYLEYDASQWYQASNLSPLCNWTGRLLAFVKVSGGYSISTYGNNSINPENKQHDICIIENFNDDLECQLNPYGGFSFGKRDGNGNMQVCFRYALHEQGLHEIMVTMESSSIYPIVLGQTSSNSQYEKKCDFTAKFTYDAVSNTFVKKSVDSNVLKELQTLMRQNESEIHKVMA